MFYLINFLYAIVQRQKTISFVFALFIFSLSSCKKDKDKSPPVIQVDTPLRHSTIQAGTLVRVRGRVSDDKKLQSVTIKVVSVDGNTNIAEPVSLPINGKVLDIDRSIEVGDLHTTSGAYQVIMEANDGKNREKEYVDITVNEIPRSFRKLVLLRKSGTGYAVDSLSGGSWNTFFTQAGDMSSAAINLYDQYLYIAAWKQGPLLAYNLKTNMLQWTIPADVPATGNPLFYTSAYDPASRVWWVSAAGSTVHRLKAINASGNVQKTYDMLPNRYAGAILPVQDRIITGEHNAGGSLTPQLSYYYSSGFGLDFTTVMPMKAIKIFELSNHELVVFGNNGTQGEMRVYDRNTNGFWEQFDLPAGKVYDVVQLNSNTYIVAHETGLIRLEHSPANSINIAPGNKVQTLYLDRFSGILYGGEGNQLRTYDPVTGSVLTSITTVDSVKAVLVQYNK